MEPVFESRRVMEQLMEGGDVAIAARLLSMGRNAQAVVPDCIGLSLTLLRDGLTFTLVASDHEIATLDAVQYIDSGPCVDSVQQDRVVTSEPGDPAAEARWLMFARASAAAGVASTLTLPIHEQGQIVGSVNLYAATSEAFDDHHEELGRVLGASAQDAVRNADLSFQTRLQAAAAPQRLAENTEIEIAVGIIAGRQEVTMAVARERLHSGAARAGITELQTARAVRGALGH